MRSSLNLKRLWERKGKGKRMRLIPSSSRCPTLHCMVKMENLGRWEEAETWGRVAPEEQTVRAECWFRWSCEYCDGERKSEGKDIGASALKKQMTDGSDGEDEESELELGKGKEGFRRRHDGPQNRTRCAIGCPSSGVNSVNPQHLMLVAR